jgi:hypothetical protein
MIAVFCIFTASAQKVKVQKGEIQLDGVSVAKINKPPKGSTTYPFTDMNGEVLFTAHLELKTPLGYTMPSPTLVLTGINGNVREYAIKEEVWMKFVKEDDIARYVVNCGEELITNQGIQLERLNNIFSVTDHSLSAAYDKKVEEIKKVMAKEDELANSARLQIQKNGSIIANGNKIGTVTFITSSDGFTKSYKYKVTELNNIEIASMDAAADPAARFYELNTYDGENFTVFTEKGFSFIRSNDDVARRMVIKLYCNGYTLGDMKPYFDDLIKQEEDSLLAEVGNIYQQRGYVITRQGDKVEGLVTLEFMPKDAVLNKRETQDTDFNHGNVVVVKTHEDLVDENGKVISVYEEKFYASDEVRIVVDTVQYLGVGGSLLESPLFHKIVYETEGNFVLHNPKYSTFLIKLSNRRKVKSLSYVTILGKKKEATIKKEFDEYVKCDALHYSDYNTTTKQGLIQLVNDYLEKCK